MIYMNIAMAILLAELLPVVNFFRVITFDHFGTNLAPSIPLLVYPVIDFITTFIVFLVFVAITTRVLNFSCRFPKNSPGANLLKIGIALIAAYYMIYAASVANIFGGWGNIMAMFYSHLVTKWPAIILIFIGLIRSFLSASPKGQHN